MKNHQLSKAFTLVEIMIATAIIVLLASATLAGLSVNRNRQLLFNSAEKAKAAIQQVQEFAAHPRSQDFRPLYYAVNFKQIAKTGFTATLIVLLDDDNNGFPNGWPIPDQIRDRAIEISTISLSPATVSEGILNVLYIPVNPPLGKWLPIDLLANPFQPVWLGYRVGNSKQIVAYLPNMGNLITNPGDIKEANAKFDFADADTSNAYTRQNPNTKKYPVIYFENYGSKIYIGTDY